MRISSTRGESTPTDSIRWDSSWPRSVTGDELEAIWNYLAERFGVPEDVLAGFSLWQRGETYYAASIPSDALQEWIDIKIVTLGLPFIRRVNRFLKPTSPALRFLSPWVTRNRVRLKEELALRLLAQGEIPWTEEASEGYVLMETDSGVLGCGLMLPGRLRSQIARSEVRAVRPGS